MSWKKPCCGPCAADFEAGRQAILAAAGQPNGQQLGGLQGFETDFLPNRYEINAAADELQTQILTFARDFTSRATPSDNESYQRFLDQWNTFVGDFNAWHDDWWWSTWSRREELLQFRRRYNQLVAEYQAMGGRPSQVVKEYDEQEISTDDKGPPSQWHSTIKWIAAGAIVLGGVYVLGPAIRTATKAGARRLGK